MSRWREILSRDLNVSPRVQKVIGAVVLGLAGTTSLLAHFAIATAVVYFNVKHGGLQENPDTPTLGKLIPYWYRVLGLAAGMLGSAAGVYAAYAWLRMPERVAIVATVVFALGLMIAGQLVFR